MQFIDLPVRGEWDYSGIPKADFTHAGNQMVSPSNPNNAKVGEFAFGTLDLQNTLDSLRVFNGTVIQYDRDLLSDQIPLLLEAQNHLTAEQLMMFANVTTERFIRTGGTDSFVMEDVSQTGIPSAQKDQPTGFEQGWPLRRKAVGLQWTTEYFRQLPAKLFANQLQALLTADTAAVAKEIRRAIFRATNTTFIDRFKDSYALPVRCLVNADSWPIPPNGYGTTFVGSTHTHYMYPGGGNGDTVTDAGSVAWNNSSTPAQKAANLSAMLSNLREHYTDGTAQLIVSQTEAPFFTTTVTNDIIPGFQKYEYSYIVPNITRDHIDQSRATFNPVDTYNRALGMFDGMEVWVKPWCPAGYVFMFDITKPKPVTVRVPDASTVGQTVNGSSSFGNGDLRFVFERETFPLYAQAMVRDFGMAASGERQNGVVMYLNSASAYTIPSSLA